MSRKKYIDRLYNEWVKHGKIVIGVDFDDTISPWKNSSQEECNRIIKLVKLAKETGAYIVIYSSCKKERYNEIINYCNIHGLNIDTINTNPIELPYGNDPESKPYCNIYLDDRAGLEEAYEILSIAMFRLRGKLFEDDFNMKNML